MFGDGGDDIVKVLCVVGTIFVLCWHKAGGNVPTGFNFLEGSLWTIVSRDGFLLGKTG